MLTLELTGKLITWYLDTVLIIESIDPVDNINEIKNILSERYVMHGVCNCAQRVFGVNIIKDPFVLEFTPKYKGGNLKDKYNEVYWCGISYLLDDKYEMIDRLVKRVQILKKIRNMLKEIENANKANV